MDEVIDKLIEHIKKNNIKFITISESNHRSYTSHTFHYKLAKKLYQEGIIDTFSSERMSFLDDLVINYYLDKKLDLDNILPELSFGGMGYYRILKFLSKQKRNSYRVAGFEQDKYCLKSFKKLNKNFLQQTFSEEFIEDMAKGMGIKRARVVNDNDIRLKNSIIDFYDREEDRETFWLRNLKIMAEARGNLFINGYHLSKNDKIGKYLNEKYPGQTLCLSMAAYDIKTQVLIVDKQLYPSDDDFNYAINMGKYLQKVENVKKIAPPTKFEEKMMKKEESCVLVKVTKRNEDQYIRSIGCYLGVYDEDYYKGNNITYHVSYQLKKYDYVIFIKKSVYKEKMFY